MDGPKTLMDFIDLRTWFLLHLAAGRHQEGALGGRAFALDSFRRVLDRCLLYSGPAPYRLLTAT